MRFEPERATSQLSDNSAMAFGANAATRLVEHDLVTRQKKEAPAMRTPLKVLSVSGLSRPEWLLLQELVS